MIGRMGDEIRFSDSRKRRKWLVIVGLVVIGLLLFGSRLLAIYVDALWFSSLGFSAVYWYKFKLGGALVIVFLVATFVLMRLGFSLLGRALPQLMERPRVRLASVEDMRDVNVLPYLYRPGTWIVSGVVALLFSVRMSQAWPEFALFLNSAPAGAADPIFFKDVSFYLFEYPVWEALTTWLLTIAFVLSIAAFGGAGYIWWYERALGFATAATRSRVVATISLAGAGLCVALSVRAYLDRFDILFAQHQLFSGASYTDANLLLPALTVVMAALLASAVVLIVNALTRRRGRLVAWLGGVVAVVWLAGIVVIPQAVYSFSVKPNELAKESPFIRHNIEMTRRAFGLDRFEERAFDPAPSLTVEQVSANRDMLDNIRLWDRGALKAVLSQIQEIRTYYEFRTPHVDRYVIDNKLKQVILAPREINVDQLPEKKWINQHVVYTHGYGITMSTVNEFTPEGLPHLLLKNMPVESEVPEIKVTRPEIYFGETTDKHVYVHTKPQIGDKPEFNYPAPNNEDSYSEYEGAAGIRVGGMFRKAALAAYLGDGTNLLFSDFIHSESRVLIRRTILDRIQHIVPFLLFEPDPYIVISREGRLYWILDAFTHSERYPYSSHYQLGGQRLNYIRNSIKAVVDAYNGDVVFYVFEPEDPIIRTYSNIFPSLFRPADEMPEDLRAHVRYPSLLLSVQANAYTLYHMQEPQTFYNHEDLWAIPSIEPSGQQGAEAQPIQPYHVLVSLPGEDNQLEFINIMPFTPAGPGRNNMIGWMAARSDADKYGQTLVFSFPKNVTINGPAQIRARVNQDAELAGQITLWNQQGSRVLRGSLLVIPIASSLLYIEPFYLQAENSPMPELRQVAIATQDRLGTGRNFAEALSALFPGLSPQEEAVLPPRSESSPAAEQPVAAADSELEGLLRQARELLSEYEKLTAEGKHREAGDKLDRLKQILGNSVRRHAGS